MPQKRSLQLPTIQYTPASIGQNIVTLRKQQGLTQQQLAQAIGITQTLISRYELGKLQISADMLVRIAIALQVSADAILGLEHYQDNQPAPSLKIMRRLKKIETLPESDQKALLKTIDKYIE